MRRLAFLARFNEVYLSTSLLCSEEFEDVFCYSKIVRLISEHETLSHEESVTISYEPLLSAMEDDDFFLKKAIVAASAR